MCDSQVEIKKTVSAYFVGFVTGLPLMVLPDSIGRKNSMNLALVLAVFSVYLIIYGSSMNMKKIGFFIQGIFHLRITISFTHLIELVNNESKAFC